MKPQSNGRVGRYDLVTPMIPCKDEIMAKFEKILMSGTFILGEEVRLLEQEIAEACQVPAAVGVASGSSALFVALSVAGVRPGDEVITTPYTFDATMEAIVLLDAVPVFVDIRPTDLNIDPAAIEAAITPKTRAILPVHIFGAPADMNPINEIAARHNVQVIVDMAQAFGTVYDGRPCGSYGRMSTISFYPTKNLPGIGDGGMVLCRDEQDADLIRRIRGHQAVRMNGHLYTGWNSRLDEIQAMAIRVRHARFAAEQADRDAVAAIYDASIPAANRLRMANDGRGMKCTYHQYWVRCRERAALRATLDAAGVDTAVYYDPPLHRHVLAEYGRTSGELVHAEAAGRDVLILPIHAALPFDDARRIGAIVRDHLAATE
ncbi:MAG TPA: DegT/DnrJ/EryC1/StrS family aminotransferase [Candidatus Krumholzibacteria bacterium]|nr:DegT/DnrJ/EryC1/StrS family aminotransferase [Candidatus Krumholzibacteria bacterium]